jgi:tyrosine-specific transport protein
MTDFFADGLAINKYSKNGIIVYLLTFLPPILVVVLAPNIFIKGLSYAGICCIILLIALPLAMLLSGRHIKKYQHTYRMPGGWVTIVIGLVIAAALLIGLIT